MASFYLRDGHTVPFDDTKFNVKLLGGDQLTVVRVRSTQSLLDTLDSATQRCEGLVPVIEDGMPGQSYYKLVT